MLVMIGNTIIALAVAIYGLGMINIRTYEPQLISDQSLPDQVVSQFVKFMCFLLVAQTLMG